MIIKFTLFALAVLTSVVAVLHMMAATHTGDYKPAAIVGLVLILFVVIVI